MMKKMLAIALACAVVAPCVKANELSAQDKKVVAVEIQKLQETVNAIAQADLTQVEKEALTEAVVAETLESLPGEITGNQKRARLYALLAVGVVGTVVVGGCVYLAIKNRTANPLKWFAKKSADPKKDEPKQAEPKAPENNKQ